MSTAGAQRQERGAILLFSSGHRTKLSMDVVKATKGLMALTPEID
jgi:hypothetical protein